MPCLLLILSLVFAWFPFVAAAALLQPEFMDAVVALGGQILLPSPSPEIPPRREWQTQGTGFFYGYAIPGEQNLSAVFLVTARHVVDKNFGATQDDPVLNELSARLNLTDPKSGTKEFTIPAQGTETWFFHRNKNMDIAILPTSFEFLKSNNIDPKFISNNANAAARQKLLEIGISAGDGVFILGFPMNLTGKERNYVVVRQGVIARISEMLDGRSPTFTLDAFVFPGNSGGPVISRPEITSISGTKPQTTPYFIGMILSYLPYVDIAVSQQTRHPRITFEENSGLAEVLPVDYIDETIKAWLEAHPHFEEGVKEWRQTHPATPVSPPQ